MKTRNLFLSYPILSAFMLMFFSHKISAQSFSQFYLSEIWDEEGGAMPVFYRTATTTDNLKNVYVVGATATDSSGYDIFIQKFNSKGILLWEQTFDGGANLDDMGTDVFVDNSNNVYVTGGATQNVTDNLDLVVLKYKSNGSLEWSYFYNFGGSPIPYDGGTAITGDNSGGIYVTGASAGDTTMMDYVTLKLNDITGSQIWVDRYDYDQMNEVPAKIVLTGSSLWVSGASQIEVFPNNSWELAGIRYIAATGNNIGVFRSSGNSISGVDEANDLTTDADGNIYILGATVQDSTDFDISLYKLNEDLELLWEQHFDGYEGEDKGFGVKTDDAGNVYAVGYVTNPNQGKNYAILKYDSTGDLQWSREFNGLANLDDEAVQLVVREDRIFVTGAARNGTNSEITTIGYTGDGEIFSVKTYDSPFGLNDKPTAMGIDLDNNLIVVGQIQENDTTFRNMTVKYNIMEKHNNVVLENGKPIRLDKHILVQFDTMAINKTAIDKPNFTAGLLSEFVKPNVIDSLNQHLGFETSRLETYKIFNRMTTADSVSTTRLGDEIRIPCFWAWLKIIVPEEEDDQLVLDSLITMNYSIVRSAEFNYLYTPDSNDPLFQAEEQSSLVFNSNFQDEPHINIEPAWAIETGKNYVKVGVFDQVVYWQHEDFGDGTFSGSKVTGGWDFYNNVHIQNAEPKTNHGTAVAGIIGAIRNNGTGIAGIAGGDWGNDQNTGVQLFSLGIHMPFLVSPGNYTYIISTSDLISSIVEGAVETPSYGYGLHIQNHSHSGDFGNDGLAMKLAVHTVWRNHSVFVASRGNEGNDELLFPACYDDRQVISVMANGDDQELAHVTINGNTTNGFNSSYGGGADVMAPGITSLVTTTTSPDYIYSYGDNCSSSAHPDYQCFSGTSAAAPHVSGVAALMYSKHNTVNGAPNNLTTEDIENILETTARGSASYNPLGGWGLINAGAALEMVNYPEFFVQHGTQLSHTPTNATLTQTAQTINLLQSPMSYETGLAPGLYFADQYKLNWTLVEVLPSHLEIINWWPLGAKSTGVNSSQTIIGEHWVDASAIINGNSISIEAETYCWVAYMNILGQQINSTFIPADAPQCEFHYSLHVRNTTLNTDEYKQENVLNLYPNPTSEFVNIEFELRNSEKVTMEIYDMRGVKIALHEIGNKEHGGHTIAVNTAHLSQGLYIIKINFGEQMITKKFIKK